jgi:hypothetical protein
MSSSGDKCIPFSDFYILQTPPSPTARILWALLDTWCRHRPDERLDWMYGGGMVAQMDAEKRSEQALLGERLPDANDQPVEVRCATCAVADFSA